MNVSKMFLSAFAGCAVASSLFAEAGYVTNVLVRQRWPWSHKVDIDFTVGGTEPVDVVVHATWDGQLEPVELTRGNGLTGSAYGLCATPGHFVWDPEAAGISNTVTGFRARLSTANPDDRKYLVIDLTTGAHEFMSEEPEGGFNSDDVYKTTKMAFRRIPAGSFTMGATSAQLGILARLGGLSDYYRKNYFRSAKSVSLSDDYYMAIYRLTERQYSCFFSDKSTMYVRAGQGLSNNNSYKRYRGLTNSCNQAINWPVTRYDVSTNSFIGKFRARTGNRFLIDLPTEAQWEHAERGDAQTLWWNEGADGISGEAFTNYIVSVCNPYMSDQLPGLYNPNKYGLYDMLSSGTEVCLDAWTTASDANTVNPRGPAIDLDQNANKRVGKGGGENSQKSARSGCVVPACRLPLDIAVSNNESAGRFAYRFAIHLNSIFGE